MKKNPRIALLCMALILGACTSMPTTTTLLEQARFDHALAQRDANVNLYAAAEMRQANIALEKANLAAREDESVEKIDQLAYVARQKVALTQEVAKRRAAEASVASSSNERDQVRLQQRTQEADQARSTAQSALTRNAQLEAQLSELRATRSARGIVVTMGDVLFGSDLSRLNVEGARTAQKLANVLIQNPLRSVLIEGFADSSGTKAHNQQLSERRADAVRMALEEMGVGRERIAMRGYGEDYPVADNDSSQSRQLNRRVEIVLSDENGRVVAR